VILRGARVRQPFISVDRGQRPNTLALWVLRESRLQPGPNIASISMADQSSNKDGIVSCAIVREAILGEAV
jgi:hypothetical protein